MSSGGSLSDPLASAPAPPPVRAAESAKPPSLICPLRGGRALPGQHRPGGGAGRGREWREGGGSGPGREPTRSGHLPHQGDPWRVGQEGIGPHPGQGRGQAWDPVQPGP